MAPENDMKGSPAPGSSPDPGKKQAEAPYEQTLTKVVAKIKNEPFLFVIAIAILIVGLIVLASNLGSPDLRFGVAVIALLAFTAMLGYYLSGMAKPRPGDGTGLSPPTFQPTGDGLIDKVSAELNKIVSGKDAQIGMLFDQLDLLFKRAAFIEPATPEDRTNELEWKQLLFVISATERVLSECHLTVKRWSTGEQLETYERLRSELGEYRRFVAKVFGDEFSIAGHIHEYGLNREGFIDTLPAPTQTEFGVSADPHRIKAKKLADKLFS